MDYYEKIKQWVNPENTPINWKSTGYWVLLFVLLWIVAIIQVFELEITISAEIFLLLTGGIGSYFVGKATGDRKKDNDQLYNKKIETTFGLRPKLARTIIAASVGAIYVYLLVIEMGTNATLTFYIDQTKYEMISILFWSVIGFYAPTVLLLTGKKELPVDIESKITAIKVDTTEVTEIRKRLTDDNLNVPTNMIAQFLDG